MKVGIVVGVWMAGVVYGMPPAWDPRQPSQPFSRCSAFVNVTDQGDCNSCCASAAATAVGARACMRDGTDTVISQLQIWDCTGGTCGDGVDMAAFVQALTTEGAGVQDALVDAAACPAAVISPSADAEPGACSLRGAMCGGRPAVAVGGHQEYWATPDGYAEVAARIRGEIWANGPVVAVITLAPADFTRFAVWTSADDAAAAFAPTDAALAAGDGVWVRHCVAVYGWDAGGAWLVQNSFGKAWGSGGRARLNGTLIGAQWFTIDKASAPCVGPAGCIRATTMTTAAAAAVQTTTSAASGTDTASTSDSSGDASALRTTIVVIIGLSLALLLTVVLVACARMPTPAAAVPEHVVDFAPTAPPWVHNTYSSSPRYC